MKSDDFDDEDFDGSEPGVDFGEFSRFDLEQALLECWQISDDLSLVAEKLLDGQLNDEHMANILLGLSELHLLRCQKTDEIFEDLIKSRKLL